LSKKIVTAKPILSVQIIVLTALAWSVGALLFFLLFSVAPTQGERPQWYGTTTYVLENMAFLGAGLLCFRNWRSSLIVSGRTVWLAIGLGMFSYFIGNLILAYWEIGLGLKPDVSPGDLFFVLTYLFLAWGMLQAVLSKQLNLSLLQWMVLMAIAVSGVTIALFFAPISEDVSTNPANPASVAIEKTVSISGTQPSSQPSPQPSSQPTAQPTIPDNTLVPASSSASAIEKPMPRWVTLSDRALAPLATIVSWLYIVGDVTLVVMATTLLLAFWGGRFSQSWRFIAAAAFSFYIADIWFNYAINYITNYQTGALPEVFWIFSGCLFGIGATLEYDLSTRRRTVRRRS
jgi:hypothetical protein